MLNLADISQQTDLSAMDDRFRASAKNRFIRSAALVQSSDKALQLNSSRFEIPHVLDGRTKPSVVSQCGGIGFARESEAMFQGRHMSKKKGGLTTVD
jgi:hypothetical protein